MNYFLLSTFLALVEIGGKYTNSFTEAKTSVCLLGCVMSLTKWMGYFVKRIYRVHFGILLEKQRT